MRTQSPDTSIEAELFQIRGLRAFPPAKKFASVRSISASMIFTSLHAAPQATSDAERATQIVQRLGPPTLAAAFQSALATAANWTLQPFDLLDALTRMHAAIGHAAIAHALTGATAWGIYGFPGGVSSIDLLVDLREEQIPALIKRLRRRHIVVERNWRKQFRQDKLFHCISLTRLVRINCIVPGHAQFDQAALRRAQQLTLDDQLPTFPVLIPADCLIQGMQRYRADGERDDAIYNDLLGVLKLQLPNIDTTLLHARATTHNLAQLLQSLLYDADSLRSA